MGDLISREAALDKLREFGRRVQGDTIMDFETRLMSITILDCINIVKESPAVDAEPVRHGRWKSVKEPGEWGYTAPMCSACGLVDYSGTFRYFNYCPNCGAKMDKEGEANEQGTHP